MYTVRVVTLKKCVDMMDWLENVQERNGKTNHQFGGWNGNEKEMEKESNPGKAFTYKEKRSHMDVHLWVDLFLFNLM